jgi:photosystem II stability/assembly factor-like uncharacterized protein
MRFDRSSIAAPFHAFLALLAATAILAGCSNKSPVKPATKPLSRVVLSAHADTLTVGGQLQFVATAYDTNDVATGEVSIFWQSTDPAVCRVTGSGLVTAMGEGSAFVIASASGKADTAVVYVLSSTTGWYTQASGTTSNLAGVCFLPDGHTGFAVGVAGTMVATTNAGANWAPHASGTAADLASVWFSDAGTGWAVGKGGTLMRTINAGSTWLRQANLPTGANLECVRFVDAQHGWIVGGGGGIAGGFVARTRNGGATWTTRTLGGAVLYGVAFADTLNGWAVGQGVVYGTHDGGTSWYLVQPSLTSQTLRGVARAGNALAWAVGGQGSIARSVATSDSLAWSLSSAGTDYTLNAIHMVSATTGWIAGGNLSNGAILATHDGGTTWTPQVSASDRTLSGVYFADGLRGWAVGAAGRIVHTSTAGAP